MAKTTNKENKLEQSFEQLSEIVKNLEASELSLEESFALYQDGMKLLKVCSDEIDKVEKKIIVLSENGEVGE